MPLESALLAAATLAAVCWVLSLLSGDDSWVDRLWSVTPALYVVWFAVSSTRADPRLLLMAFLVVAWGARLTYNFARKGGYRAGGEDYRWPILRERMSPALYAVFRIVFICAFQHGLLLLLSLPAWIVASRPASPLNVLDLAATAGFVVFLAGETVADQQQWDFHRSRSEPGFLSAGLFRYSRHPNFFCEQGIWWAFYLFGIAAGAGWLNPSLAGPAVLTLLFQGSTAFTESISASKYPGYAEYRRRTSRLIPLPPRR